MIIYASKANTIRSNTHNAVGRDVADSPQRVFKSTGGLQPKRYHVFQCLEPNNPIYLWLLAMVLAGLDLF